MTDPTVIKKNGQVEQVEAFGTRATLPQPHLRGTVSMIFGRTWPSLLLLMIRQIPIHSMLVQVRVGSMWMLYREPEFGKQAMEVLPGRSFLQQIILTFIIYKRSLWQATEMFLPLRVPMDFISQPMAERPGPKCWAAVLVHPLIALQ